MSNVTKDDLKAARKAAEDCLGAVEHLINSVLLTANLAQAKALRQNDPGGDVSGGEKIASGRQPLTEEQKEEAGAAIRKILDGRRGTEEETIAQMIGDVFEALTANNDGKRTDALQRIGQWPGMDSGTRDRVRANASYIEVMADALKGDQETNKEHAEIVAALSSNPGFSQGTETQLIANGMDWLNEFTGGQVRQEGTETQELTLGPVVEMMFQTFAALGGDVPVIVGRFREVLGLEEGTGRRLTNAIEWLGETIDEEREQRIQKVEAEFLAVSPGAIRMSHVAHNTAHRAAYELAHYVWSSLVHTLSWFEIQRRFSVGKGQIADCAKRILSTFGAIKESYDYRGAMLAVEMESTRAFGNLKKSDGTVEQKGGRNGAERRGGRSPSPETAARNRRICADFAQGLTVDDVCEKYGISADLARKVKSQGNKAKTTTPENRQS